MVKNGGGGSVSFGGVLCAFDVVGLTVVVDFDFGTIDSMLGIGETTFWSVFGGLVGFILVT